MMSTSSWRNTKREEIASQWRIGASDHDEHTVAAPQTILVDRETQGQPCRRRHGVAESTVCREVPIRRYAQALQHNAAGTLARSMAEHDVLLRLAKRRVGLEHFDDPTYHRRDQLARPRVELTGFTSSIFRSEDELLVVFERMPTHV